MQGHLTLTGSSHGRTVTVDFDHTDVGLPEVLEAFHVIAIGLTWDEGAWRRVIAELADQYEEDYRPTDNGLTPTHMVIDEFRMTPEQIAKLTPEQVANKFKVPAIKANEQVRFRFFDGILKKNGAVVKKKRKKKVQKKKK